MSDLSQFMERDVKTISADATLWQAAQRMCEARASYLLVEDSRKPAGDQFVGIITEADLARRAIPEKKDLNQVKVRVMMSQPIITVDISVTMAQANDVMKGRGIRHLGITENQRTVGMLTMLGLLRYFMKKAQA